MSTSPDLFARHREAVQVNTDDDDKCDDDLEDDGLSVNNDLFSTSEGGANNQTTEPTPTKAKKRSEPASTKKKGKTKAAKKVSTEIDGFNDFMLTLAKTGSKRGRILVLRQQQLWYLRSILDG
jgi:hypothetical protein